jgi:lipopolysaccharide transport system ATP-binding protein
VSDIAIRVDHLSKRYRIGGPKEPYGSLRDSLMAAVRGPLQALRRRRKPPPADFWALKDVSFEVKQGEVLGIIGRNGAGKSTLLKVLSRITEPTGGQVELHGRVGALLEVGTGFHPELTGRENIYLNGTILGMSRSEINRKFDEIVEFAGVAKFIETPVKRFSSGMYLRLAFAVAAHLEPEILIVDEVLAVGDAQFQKKCLGKMAEVSRQGRTVLFVSHDLTAVTALCQHGLLLLAGKVERTGPAPAVVSAYLSEQSSAVGGTTLTDRSDNSSPLLRFESVDVFQRGVQSLGVVDTDTDVEVRIVYRLSQAVSGIEVSINLFTQHGVYLLSSSDVDTNLDLDRTRPPGRYEGRCRIPRFFLRSGRYSITLGCSYPNVETVALVKDVIEFEVIDPTGIPATLGHTRPSIITPRLEWQTEEIVA